MGQFWKSETFQKKKNHRVYNSLKAKLRKWNSRESGWTGLSLPRPCILCFIPCLISFSLWWNEQTTAAAASAGSRHNIFNNDTISSFYTSFASHIANKTATAWNTTTTKKKKVLVQENMRFRAQRWEDIGLDSCSNIFPGPPLFSSSSSSSSSSTLGCSRRQSRLTP